MNGYGMYLDSAYYEIWSDSSWEKFNHIINFNGHNYVTTINKNGDEYYYDAVGYAGFKAKGQSLIIFDKPVSSFPDSIVFGQEYTRGTTFYYQGYNYTMKYQQTLQDTVSVSVPFGVFDRCLWFKSTYTLSAGGQSSTSSGQFWLAQGPGAIKQTLNSGITIVMVRGIVNGKGWGMPFPGSQFSFINNHERLSLKNIMIPLIQNLSPRWLTSHSS